MHSKAYCQQFYDLHTSEWEMGPPTPLTMLAFVFSSSHCTAPSPSLKVHCGRDLTLAPESEGEPAGLPSAFLRELTRVLRVHVLEGVQTFSFTSRQTTIARNLTLWSVLWDLSQWSAIGSSESQARVERDTCAIYFPHFCNVWTLDHKQA